MAVPSAGEAQPTGCDGSRRRKSARERRVSARWAGSARMESRHAARRKTGSRSASADKERTERCLRKPLVKGFQDRRQSNKGVASQLVVGHDLIEIIMKS